MKAKALRARQKCRAKPTDRGNRSEVVIASNLLDRQFVADAPNKRWVADFTYIWTAEGWLYVAAVLDLYSRRVVGWSMQNAICLSRCQRNRVQPNHTVSVGVVTAT